MADECLPKHYRFTNVTDIDIIPHLSFPSISAPACSSRIPLQPNVNESAFARDPRLIDHLQQLLSSADASYVRPYTAQQRPNATSRPTLLEELILRRDPHSFQSCPSERPSLPSLKDPAESTKKVAPVLQELNVLSEGPDTDRERDQDKGPFVRQAKRQRRSHLKDSSFDPSIAVSSTFSGDVDQILVGFLHSSGQDPDLPVNGGAVLEIGADGGDHGATESLIAHINSFGDELDVAFTLLKNAKVEHLRAVLSALSKAVKAGQRECLGADDEEDSITYQSILLSVEASIACLKLMSAPGMPKQIYNEELIEAILETMKFNLINNVLVFYDPRLRQLHRPTLFEADDGMNGRSKGKKRKSTGVKGNSATARVPEGVEKLRGRMEKAMLLMTDLLSVVQLPPSMVLTLLRQASQCLTVDGLDVLQVAVVGLLVSGFAHYESQRTGIMEDLISGILPNLSIGKGKLARSFMISGHSAGAIMMFSALVLQLLQSAITLPKVSTDVKALRDSFAPATHYADIFWVGLFDRLPSRGSKNDTETDVRMMLEQILQDICTVLSLPEWPAAATALMRLITTLGSPSGLYNADNAVRQVSVDVLGTIAARVFMEANTGENEDEYIRECILKEVGALSHNGVLDDDPHQLLLLQYLCDRRHTRTSLREAAVTFVLCRAFVDEVTNQQKKELPEDEQSLLLTKYRELETLLKRGTQVDISEEEAIQLARAVMQSGPLGRGRQTLLKWLLDAADPVKQAPTTRAKAIKALSQVLQSDSRIAKLQEVQGGINRALKDDAASVRQNAVDLLGSSIQRDRDLVETYFDTLVAASKDPSSTSVRKAALKILHENCIKVSGSRHATDACVAVLHRVVDHEESMHDFVARVAHELWLSDSGGEDWRSNKGSVVERAEQLAQVAQAMYLAGGPAIHLPFELNHPLIMVLRKALQREAKAGCNKVSQAGRQIADALLEGILQAFDSAPGSTTLAFPYLVALHAFCLTDAQLCTPPDDPGRFLRCLAPYLKVSKPEVYTGLAPEQRCLLERREAEQILCILSILSSVFDCLENSDSLTTPDLEADLRHLIHQHPYIQVVSSACKALAALSKHQPSAAKILAALFRMYLDKLVSQRSFDFSGQHTAAAICGRFLYVMGHLVRHGADIIEADPSNAGYEAPIIQHCAEVIMDFFDNPTGELKVRGSALQALGGLCIARPTCMLGERARKLQKAVLQRNAAHDLKIRALNNLADLLKAEEQRLIQKQGDTLDEATHKGDGAGDQEGALATINGQKDVLTLSSSILQDQWSLVLGLATDTTAVLVSGQKPDKLSDARNGNVRRQAMIVVDAVYRNGLVAPWLGVPTLVALTTDPCSDVAAKALKVLKRLAEKEPDMFQAGLAEGLETAADFQTRLSLGHEQVMQGGSGAADEVIRGMSSLYAELVQPHRNFRTAFIAKLLKKFDAACNLHSHGARKADLKLLLLIAHVAACLPFKKGDELLTLIFQIDALVSRRGDDVVASFGDAVKKVTPNQEDGSPNSLPKAKRLLSEANASLALSMLLMVKQYLKIAYGISAERIGAFHPNNMEKRKVEERLMVARNNSVPLMLSKLNMDAVNQPDELLELYKIVSSLLREDAAEHAERAAAASALGEDSKSEVPAHADGAYGNTETPFVLYTAAQKQAASRGSRGGRRGRGTGRGSKHGKSREQGREQTRKRKSAVYDDDESGEDPEDEFTPGQPRRLEMHLVEQDPW